ncbi:DDE Tnp4 domain-containing protein [Trichonephila clavata]|uniref:DDE Tnp4 domain-containing protein n=1 Tax=Trichonephila clavata TaxID=2740835 RepID=A0A8X6JDY9_TRICU|nr:DDE Tnp4 domain-containing protein [Trichonephila clavata]
MDLVGQEISKQDTNYRKSITAEERHSICLSYLITDHSFTSLIFYYRVGLSTIHEIVKETTQALWNALQPCYMAVPSPDEWSKIAQDYNDKWNMPNCIGSIYGKHCRIQRPPNAGSLFYNYKDFHSIVLLAVADACFTMIEVGAYGKENDHSIFIQSEMGKAYNAWQLNVP